MGDGGGSSRAGRREKNFGCSKSGHTLKNESRLEKSRKPVGIWGSENRFLRASFLCLLFLVHFSGSLFLVHFFWVTFSGSIYPVHFFQLQVHFFWFIFSGSKISGSNISGSLYWFTFSGSKIFRFTFSGSNISGSLFLVQKFQVHFSGSNDTKHISWQVLVF